MFLSELLAQLRDTSGSTFRPRLSRVRESAVSPSHCQTLNAERRQAVMGSWHVS